MQEVIINIKNDQKACYLLKFLRQLDFIEVKRIKKIKILTDIERDIKKSFNDLNNGKVSSWNNIEVTLNDTQSKS